MQHTLPESLRSPLSSNVSLLLESRIPARIGWVSPNRTPRVLPIWFEWDGTHLVMATFAGSKKLEEIGDGTIVSATIDTSDFPYRSLKMTGSVSLEAVDGLAEQYRSAAARYLGEELGARWCDSLAAMSQVLIRLAPTTATASDMSTMPFMVPD